MVGMRYRESHTRTHTRTHTHTHTHVLLLRRRRRHAPGLARHRRGVQMAALHAVGVYAYTTRSAGTGGGAASAEELWDSYQLDLRLTVDVPVRVEGGRRRRGG